MSEICVKSSNCVCIGWSCIPSSTFAFSFMGWLARRCMRSNFSLKKFHLSRAARFGEEEHMWWFPARLLLGCHRVQGHFVHLAWQDQTVLVGFLFCG